MILECEKCNARFLVADSMLPAEGRTVRCGACAHQWFVQGPAPTMGDISADAVPIFDPVDNNGEGIEFSGNVPAISKKRMSVRPFKIAAPLLAIAWVFLAFVTYFPSWMKLPVLSSLYSMIGTKPTDGLLFDDVHMEREESQKADDARTRYIISGSIVNHAAEDRLVPTVHVALKDKDGKAMWGRDYPVNNMLKAGEVYPFRIDNIQTSFAEDVTSIVVDMGNSLQLVMR